MSLAVVQSVANAYKFDGSTTNVKFTWGSAPTSGNLLVMVVGSWQSTQPSFTGWTQDTINTSGGWYLSVYYRYAGASEPTTVTDANSHLAWCVHAWEISGVSGTWATDHVKTSLAAGGGGTQGGPTGSTISPTSITTQTQTALCLAGFNSYSETASTTYTVGGSFTLDSQFCTATADASNGLFDFAVGAHEAVSGGASVVPTLTPNHTTFWTYNLVELGSSGPSTETGNVSLALSKVGFNVSAVDDPAAAAVHMALSKVSFTIEEERTETATADIALKPVAFNAQAHRVETGAATLALEGVAIAATGLDQGTAGSGSVHFATFGA